MSLSFRPGDIIANDFAIERVLSEGGMGRVYVARQLSTGKQRALKVMLAELVQDAKLRERFAREAQVGSRIHSDHIVEVIAAGIDRTTGAPWLAMELLEGHPLADLCAHYSRLDLEDRPFAARAMAEEILRQLCHGLGAAHRAGIVHRDLKPDNVFLAKPRRVGVTYTVKILDFGIAKIAAEAKTQATATIGSPFWMAPEQTQQGATVTPATDVWALGLITFQLLTGRNYWLTARSADPTPIQVLRELAFDPIPPAGSRASELGYRHALPAGFDAWFSRCVCRDMGSRFPDATQAYAALAPMLQPPPAATARPMAATIAAAPLDLSSVPASHGSDENRTWLLHRTKTLEKLDHMADPRAKALQRFALMTVLQRMHRGDRPAAPFDLFYFSELVDELFADKSVIETLLHGDIEKLDWLPE